MKEIRESIESKELREEMKESLSDPVDLLGSQMRRLALKEAHFQTFAPCKEDAMNDLWKRCTEIAPGVQVNLLKSII